MKTTPKASLFTKEGPVFGCLSERDFNFSSILLFLQFYQNCPRLILGSYLLKRRFVLHDVDTFNG